MKRRGFIGGLIATPVAALVTPESVRDGNNQQSPIVVGDTGREKEIHVYLHMDASAVRSAVIRDMNSEHAKRIRDIIRNA